MSDFRIKANINDTMSIEVLPFNYEDLCKYFDLSTQIKINLASIQLFGGEGNSSEYDVNINDKILAGFHKLEDLYNFLSLPLEYNIFELQLDIFDKHNCKVTIDGDCLSIFEVHKDNTEFLKNICAYLSDEEPDNLYSLVISNLGKYVLGKLELENKFNYKILSEPFETKD